MNESQWDDKLRAFLKKTSEDLKRAGTDIRSEAERLMQEVKDPNRQEKVKKGLESFTVWARKTAEEVATVVESGVKKAEVAVRTAAEKAHSPAETPLRHDTPVDEMPAVAAPTSPAKKSMGGGKKKGAARVKDAKKTLGKKRAP